MAGTYWAVAVILAVLAAVGGAQWGLSQAPSFDGDDNNGAPATSASHIIYSVFGAIICGLAVLALASGVFFVLWARERRRRTASEDDDVREDDMDIDEVEGMFVADDDSSAASPTPHDELDDGGGRDAGGHATARRD
ncbi:hypothetical protein [Allobranchiibius sp. CTAmp26]|uniref:hypothetical protein n=1 Tax=Allobranchiibius sp. CTAmp26 TaxID=2815214 RepID=UPI001AA15E1A|nr:hypothetical protein [Allobranchiibius sp. CTAmp26]MBO1754169.1 hypothetical protein [Allobranchiibius sp. CTAmp26]